MISFLKGTIEEKKEGIIALDVAGVGYELLVSSETALAAGEVGDSAKLLTYLVVRENEVFLIGFKTAEEKNLFLNLITVSGVGPKTALQIISSCGTASLLSSIISGNVSTISSAKGVGKKTAERVVLELKEKLLKENGDITLAPAESALPNSAVVGEAILALTSLGLTKAEAEGAVRDVFKEGMPLEEIISKALRRI